jgi:hypothetical protein
VPTLDQIYERKKEASSQVSALTRSIAFSFLGIAWMLLTARDDPLKSMSMHVPICLLVLLIIGSVLILIFDILQYVAVTNMADKAFHDAEREGKKDNIKYDPNSLAYKSQAFFYHAKFYTLCVVTAVLIIVFAMLFLSM